MNGARPARLPQNPQLLEGPKCINPGLSPLRKQRMNDEHLHLCGSSQSITPGHQSTGKDLMQRAETVTPSIQCTRLDNVAYTFYKLHCGNKTSHMSLRTEVTVSSYVFASPCICHTCPTPFTCMGGVSALCNLPLPFFSKPLLHTRTYMHTQAHINSKQNNKERGSSC